MTTGKIVEKEAEQEIAWDFEIPLLTNPFILLDFGKMLAIVFAFMSVLFMVIGVCMGEFLDMLRLIPMFAICTGFIGVLLVFVMLVIYGNRFPCRFTVDRKGAMYEVTSRQRKMNTLVIILGALAGKPGVAGAGMLARSQECEYFPWKDVFRVDCFPKRRVVCLRNSWRTTLRIHCTPENYETVAQMVQDGLKRTARTRSRNVKEGKEFRSDMLRRLAWWPLILISGVLATAQPLLDERFGPVWATAGVIALSAICGGNARRTLGIIGLFMAIGTIGIEMANGLKVTSYAGGLMRWNGFETATDSDDLPFFITGCVGVLGLIALSLRNIRTGGENSKH